MRDHTSERTKKHTTTARVISVNVGPNRAMRRHDSSVQRDMEEGQRTGNPTPRNKPHIKK
jgi:hypothetical protein